MEQLLRGEEIPKINPYDLTQPVVYFPVRHHSPACSFHLKRAIEAYQPDGILIEGPQNANSMIPVLVHEDTKAPLALYYFYRDSKGYVSPEKEDYKCYYPFLDCSPELVALREAKKRGITARFADLPYGEILLGTAEEKGLRRDGEKQTYNDDYLLSRSHYQIMLCEKTGLRNFEEFWEKYFEIGGLFQETETFVKQMLTYCYVSRVHSSREEMEEDGCLLRERYMAEQVAKASEEFKKLLVVTGGFHTYGILELLEQQEEKIRYIGEPVKLHGIAADDQGVYPLAYSMEATDSLNGYASGMPSPGFYHQVWERMEEKGTAGAYEDAVLHQLVNAGRKARRKKESLSSYDVICALSMAKGLAALRGKREPGLYELQDAACSSFVKGECSLSTDLPLRILKQLNAGEQVGRLCADALRPPILGDFEGICSRFHLKVQAAAQQEVTLELFTKKRHLEISRFFYQMDFLGTGFAERKKGSDLLKRKDKNRVREVWSYRFSSQVLSALVDVSMSGGTVEEAARARLLVQFARSGSTRDAAMLLTQGFLMGFLEEQTRMGEHLRQVLAEDGDFFSLTEGFSHLRMLYELRDLYQVEAAPELSQMLGICFQKIVQLIPSMGQVAKEQEQACMESLLSLYQMTGKKGFTQLRSVLLEALLRLAGQQKIQPGLEGAVLGLLYGYDKKYEDRIGRSASGYLTGTGEMQQKSAAFLRGLFFTAKDYVFVRENFLGMIDQLLGALSPEAFMELLPELRMAFSYFTPLETDRIAGKAAALHGAGRQQIFQGPKVSPLEYAYGEELNAAAVGSMQEEWM